MLGRMIAGIMETALLFGVEQVTYVASAALAPMAEERGMGGARLGPPHAEGRDKIQAFAATIDAAGLKRVRRTSRSMRR
jgi:acyl-homoserine lactone synthase